MKSFGIIVIIGVAVYVALIAVLYLMQRKMMYFPTHIKPVIEHAKIPELEEITVQTEDGLSLYGWYNKPAAGMPVIVWFHGNGSHIGWSSVRAAPYTQNGYGVLLAEYRGYAGNEGAPSEQGLYNDGAAFISWLFSNGYKASDIVVYGESIGSGVAVKMAVEYPHVRALVLEAPFVSAVDIGANAYPFIPVRLLMKDRYDNLSRIADINAPLIIAHGTNDHVVPYSQSERLYAAASDPKLLIAFDGAGHNDLDMYGLADKIMNALIKIAGD